MGDSVGCKEIKKARKAHKCDWCAEDIVRGACYSRWAWFEDGSACTVKVHPECLEALRHWDDEWTPFVHRRGCWCDEADGKYCECKKERENNV